MARSGVSAIPTSYEPTTVAGKATHKPEGEGPWVCVIDEKTLAFAAEESSLSKALAATTASGLRYFDLVEGTGAMPAGPETKVKVFATFRTLGAPPQVRGLAPQDDAHPPASRTLRRVSHAITLYPSIKMKMKL